MHYESLIIGTGTDAINAAVSAAQQGQLVCLVETSRHEGQDVTIELLKQAVERLIETGAVSMAALRNDVQRMVRLQRSADWARLAQSGVDVFTGEVRFVDSTTVEVIQGAGQEPQILSSESIVLACGTKSAQPAHLTRNGRTVIDAESLLAMDKLPQSMIVIGAGQTGLDYAIVLGMLGIEVTVIDEHSSLMDLCGGLLGDSRIFEAQALSIAFRLNDEVIGLHMRADGTTGAHLASGKTLTADAVLVCVGREGRTDGLDLETVGVGVDEEGRVWCNANGQTWNPNIKAIGEVVGFPKNTTLAG